MFKLKFKDLNKNGAGRTMQKLHNFEGFKPKTALRVNKLVTNLQAHQNQVAESCQLMGKELGGALEGQAWKFKKKESEERFNTYCADALEKDVEVNCKKLQFKEDVEPYYKEIKLTPSDWGNLGMVMDGAPVVD